MALWMDLGREVAAVEIFAWIADSPRRHNIHHHQPYKKRVNRSCSRYINIALVLHNVLTLGGAVQF